MPDPGDPNFGGCSPSAPYWAKERRVKPETYVIVRTYAMGVFAGILDAESTETRKVLRCARRIWSWSGAASLSQLAVDGTSKPKECRFPAEVSKIELTSPNGFEVLEVTSKARESIASVPVWEK